MACPEGAAFASAVTHDSFVCLSVPLSQTYPVVFQLQWLLEKKAVLMTETDNFRKCTSGLFFQVERHCRKLDFVSGAATEFQCDAELVQ